MLQFFFINFFDNFTHKNNIKNYDFPKKRGIEILMFSIPLYLVNINNNDIVGTSDTHVFYANNFFDI